MSVYNNNNNNSSNSNTPPNNNNSNSNTPQKSHHCDRTDGFIKVPNTCRRLKPSSVAINQDCGEYCVTRLTYLKIRRNFVRLWKQKDTMMNKIFRSEKAWREQIQFVSGSRIFNLLYMSHLYSPVHLPLSSLVLTSHTWAAAALLFPLSLSSSCFSTHMQPFFHSINIHRANLHPCHSSWKSNGGRENHCLGDLGTQLPTK